MFLSTYQVKYYLDYFVTFSYIHKQNNSINTYLLSIEYPITLDVTGLEIVVSIKMGLAGQLLPYALRLSLILQVCLPRPHEKVPRLCIKDALSAQLHGLLIHVQRGFLG